MWMGVGWGLKKGHDLRQDLFAMAEQMKKFLRRDMEDQKK
jgi:hypothetical protein